MCLAGSVEILNEHKVQAYFGAIVPNKRALKIHDNTRAAYLVSTVDAR